MRMAVWSRVKSPVTEGLAYGLRPYTLYARSVRDTIALLKLQLSLLALYKCYAFTYYLYPRTLNNLTTMMMIIKMTYSLSGCLLIDRFCTDWHRRTISCRTISINSHQVVLIRHRHVNPPQCDRRHRTEVNQTAVLFRLTLTALTGTVAGPHRSLATSP